MRKPILAITSLDKKIIERVRNGDHKLLATWAADCAERVLPYFQEKFPHDPRLRAAITATHEWVRTGIFKMADVRRISLAAHAAAREAEVYSPARSAARAAGHAIATAHVKTHAAGPALYAATAIRDATNNSAAVEKERQWQYQHLIELEKAHIHPL